MDKRVCGWIYVTQNRIQLQALGDTVMELQILQKTRGFLIC
jgi:hypothetical protein